MLPSPEEMDTSRAASWILPVSLCVLECATETHTNERIARNFVIWLCPIHTKLSIPLMAESMNCKAARMNTHSHYHAVSKTKNGFALVVTLSLMILLTVIAVGLLSLSSITLRASGNSSDSAAARANARMAMMLALGDLQKHAGLDTRVTARADILDVENPPVVGVWKSWEGSNHDKTTGRPVSPGDYTQTKKNRFLGWLTSGNPAVMPDSSSPPATSKEPDSVTLLGVAAVGAGADRTRLQIHLPPSKINASNRRGAFA